MTPPDPTRYSLLRQEMNTAPGELVEMPPKNTAVRFDSGKPDWSLLPFKAVEEIIKVLEFGAKKYARGNFATGNGIEYSRVINSLIRHTVAFSKGEDLDPESGLSHMAHAGANVLFLLHYEKNKDKFKNDDRAEKIVG